MIMVKILQVDSNCMWTNEHLKIAERKILHCLPVKEMSSFNENAWRSRISVQEQPKTEYVWRLRRLSVFNIDS